MKSLISLFFSVIVAYCSKVELVQVIHFGRHGARTPNSFEYKPNQYLEKQGELTPLGLLQAYLIGQELRERYVEKTNFLSKEFNPKDVYIKSSYKSRTLKTAIAFLNGLYPQENGKTHHNSYDLNTEEIIPLRNRYRTIKEEELLSFNIDDAWAVSNIDIATKEKDFFFHAYKNGNCPLAERLIDDHIHSLEAKNAEEFYKTSLFPNMEWTINTVLGEEKINKDVLTIKKAKKILDNFRCNSFHKKEHPRFNGLAVNLLKSLMQYQVYIATFKEKIVRDVAATRIFESMLDFTKRIVADRENTPKFVFYSGHDTNLEPMLYNLLSENEILSREEYTIIPFASVLAIHIYKEETQQGVNHFVEVTFNDRPLKLEWCSSSKCSLSEFQNKLDSHIVKELEQFCSGEAF